MQDQTSIVLYLHVHQPFRIRHYTIFDVTNSSNYFDSSYESNSSNERIIKKVAEKSYVPTINKLLELIQQYPEFRLSLSITGTVLEQLEIYCPEALDLFKQLISTNRVEVIGETYNHSLAFFYDRAEFEKQVQLHHQKIKEVFNQDITAFRNTELAYNNDLAYWADKAGYKAILAEGWDPILGWRSPNFVYQPSYTDNIKLLMKNYRLSDDIAFRFSNRQWDNWPLTADKYVSWLDATKPSQLINLFMDFETFGEHQWADTGIFDFMSSLVELWLKSGSNKFMTVTEAANTYPASDTIDVPNTITWADTERDLTAWLGNPMQHQAVRALYEIADLVRQSGDESIVKDWRNLQTSDHFYYMCTKWFSDGDVHAYFSPYSSPYEAFMNFINVYHDLRFRLSQKGLEV